MAAQAEELASEPHRRSDSDVPEALLELSYDEYYRIRFLDEHSFWAGDDLPFQARFFPPGYIHRDPVTLYEFTPTHVQRIPFVRTFFDFDGLDIPGRLPGSIDYAGFRLLAWLNAPERQDELVSFLGASYYRALGRNQRYGISARGIAIDSGLPTPEELRTWSMVRPTDTRRFPKSTISQVTGESRISLRFSQPPVRTAK